MKKSSKAIGQRRDRTASSGLLSRELVAETPDVGEWKLQHNLLIVRHLEDVVVQEAEVCALLILGAVHLELRDRYNPAPQ